MLKAATTPIRAPRGAKPVSQAFLTALDAVPEPSRAAVARAAMSMIRHELKARNEKMKTAAAKAKENARTPTPVKLAAAKTPAAKSNGAHPIATSIKRRNRKALNPIAN